MCLQTIYSLYFQSCLPPRDVLHLSLSIRCNVIPADTTANIQTSLKTCSPLIVTSELFTRPGSRFPDTTCIVRYWWVTTRGLLSFYNMSTTDNYIFALLADLDIQTHARIYNQACTYHACTHSRLLARTQMSALVAYSAEEMQKIGDAFSNASKKFGLKINIKKTEVLYQPNSTRTREEDIMVDGNKLNSVLEFTYLCIPSYIEPRHGQCTDDR